MISEIEENNRMGKTRDLFKKMRDTRGIFHVKKGSLKDRNGMDLTKSEDIKNKQKKKKNTHKNTQKNCAKRSSQPRQSQWYDHSPRTRHPGM